MPKSRAIAKTTYARVLFIAFLRHEFSTEKDISLQDESPEYKLESWRKIMKKLASAMTLSLLSLTFFTAAAEASTRIKFAKGSYCGSYSGNFSNGREFVLGLSRGQTFSSRNIGDGTQYDVYVIGPAGRVAGNKVDRAQINYPIPASGDYRVYLESSTPYSSVEFCAY